MTILKLLAQLLWCGVMMGLPLVYIANFENATFERVYFVIFVSGVAYSQTVQWVGAQAVRLLSRAKR